MSAATLYKILRMMFLKVMVISNTDDKNERQLKDLIINDKQVWINLIFLQSYRVCLWHLKHGLHLYIVYDLHEARD
ncbi:uncharacterized protein PADG_06846 [Paracoccidioides brasiliensis Pb18]|uniref:Uncharacterized protein n=1 Tax=Paracoccidioides brasiliensis (strain Pb18) TaxID=502780 RepID=C1GHW0_PARBD|nr:uncharacterized protein PADG_06846 [Paracoccidioides brasiliensis Pb18]EEH50767.2 hypothetical protein PADG_06846 [Paracoccidioides brasiliensis Pb18]